MSNESIQAPVVVSLIPCDQTYQDGVSQKNSLLGIFGAIVLVDIPLQHGGFAVFLEVTDGRGAGKFQVRLVHTLSDSTVASVSGTATFVDPLQVLAIGLRMPAFTFTHFGEHRLEFLFNGNVIDDRRIMVVKKNADNQQPPNNEPGQGDGADGLER